MSNKTVVDIILPNYNSNEFLEETLKSILSQSFKNWRLIIVDDCSSSSTKKILRNYSKNKKIKIIFLKKNRGTGFCRNLALSKCKSKYIAFIDSDDLWTKDKLKKQINFMKKNNYDFTYTNYLAFKGKDKKFIINPPLIFDYKKFVKNTSIATSSMIIKNKIAKKYRFLSTKICEDYFYKCSVLKRVKKAHCLNKNLMHYRIRTGSLQSNKIRNVYWIWKINKKFNKMNFIENTVSLISISFNSLLKYRLK